MQLGFFPRLMIKYTNPNQSGQIYLPIVNAALAIGSIYVVLFFGSSEHLAAAYGIAVTGTMVATSVAFYFILRHRWRWSVPAAGLLCGAFLAIDVPLFASNLHKFHDGGWFPIVVAVGIIAIMHTWKLGKEEIYRRIYANEITEDELVNIAGSERIARVRGTAVFMAGVPTGTPLVLLHHVKANKVLHETVVLLSVVTEEVPAVPEEERLGTARGARNRRGLRNLARHQSLRLHGVRGRQRAHGAHPRNWRAGETQRGDLLFQPRDGDHRRRHPHVALAKTPVRPAQPQRPSRARLLSPASDADHRGRVADPTLTKNGSTKSDASAAAGPTAPR
jgi:hypothetical protein